MNPPSSAQQAADKPAAHYYYLPLKITLLQELVLSSSAASGAQHTCLPYLPGANLLGAFAAQFYRSIGAELGAELGARAQRWLFHSGALSFGDAHTICGQDGKLVKANSLESAQQLYIAQALPLSHGLPKDCVWQAQQTVKLKRRTADSRAAPVAEYLASGHLLQIPMSYRVKSAREPQTGAAADGLLFAYQALPAGICLYAELRVELRADLSTDLSTELSTDSEWQSQCLRKISSKLIAAGMRLQLGKSRSAEYGSAQLHCLSDWQQHTPDELQQESEFDLLLLSDLALEANGMPSLQAHPEYFGWPQGEWLAAESFFKTRRYSPYHGHYRSQDSERLVLTRGSVLRYRLAEPPDAATWCKMQNQAWLGLGRYVEAGLGRACLWPCNSAASEIPNQTPKLMQDGLLSLQTSQLSDAAQQVESAGASQTENQEADALFAWLQQTVQSSEAKSRDSSELIANLQNLYRAGKRMNGQGSDGAWGPSRAQWGRLRTCAAAWPDLRDMLRSEIKKDASPWTQEVRRAEGQARSCLAWVWQILGFTVPVKDWAEALRQAQPPFPEKLELLRRLAYEAQQAQVRGSKT